MGLLVGLMDKMGLLMLRSEQAQPPRGERGYQPMGPPRSFESCNFVNHSFDNSSDILETKWKEADVYISHAFKIKRRRYRPHYKQTTRCTTTTYLQLRRLHSTLEPQLPLIPNSFATTPTFRGGAKRYHKPNNTDNDDETTLAEALIELATTSLQRKQDASQPPHNQRKQRDRPQTTTTATTTKNNTTAATTRTPKLDLYASVHNIFQDKSQDPLQALTDLVNQAHQIRQGRHNKRQQLQSTITNHNEVTTKKHNKNHLAILTDTSNATTTDNQQEAKPPRLTFTTRTSVMSGTKLIQLLEDQATLREGYAMVTHEEAKFIK